MSHAEQARTFAEALFGDHGELLAGCHLTVTSLPGPQTRWTPAKVDSLCSAVLRAAQGTVTGVYVGVGLTRGATADAKRLDVKDTAGIAFLWADIDFAGTARESKKPYCPNAETAVAIAHSLGLAPTVVTNTGHGIHAFWRLSEPFIFGAIDSDEDGVPVIDPERVDADRARAVKLAKAWVTTLQIRARQKGGWAIDSVGDLARIMRVPGTHNRMLSGEELPVQIIECDPTRRYELESFEASLAPEALLNAYEGEGGEAGGELAGVDLAGLWVEVRGAKDFLPAWLPEVLDSGFADVIDKIFSGRADAEYDNDDSAIDMALARAVLREELGVECAAQAVMSRRLRVNRRVEKVDPGKKRGVDYLSTMINKIAAGMRAGDTAVAAHHDQIRNAVAAMTPPDPEPDPESPGADLTLVPEDTDKPEPLRLTRVEPEPDPTEVHADAPHAPRQGIDSPMPAPPDASEMSLGAQLAVQLGLPQGVSVWAVGMRRLEKHDEVRLWLLRDASSVVAGGRWRPNTVGSTRWRAKSEWGERGKVAELIWNDLHLSVEMPPGRAWRTEGRPRLYQVARRMEEGTPAEVTRRAIVGLLRRTEGTVLFSTALTSRDPWVTGDTAAEIEVWLPLDSVRAAITQAGFPPQSAVKLMDTLDEMGCKIPSTTMAVVEDHRTVCDELTWVRLAADILTPDLTEHVFLRKTDRDAQDKRSELRMLGPT